MPVFLNLIAFSSKQQTELFAQALENSHRAGYRSAYHGVVAQSSQFCVFVYFVENGKVFITLNWIISTTRLRNYVYLCKCVRNIVPTNVSTLCQLSS